MTDEELKAYEAALRRAVEAGGEFAEEDQPILKRARSCRGRWVGSSLGRRLEKLEAGAEKDTASRWEVPIETRLYLTMVARHQARAEGEEPPPYTHEEIEEMRRSDIETVEGRGTEAQLRASIGWQSPEAQQSLDEWEQEARRRLELAKDLPAERWGEVWGVHG